MSHSVIESTLPATPFKELEVSAALSGLDAQKDEPDELVNASRIRELMWEYVGIERHARGLEAAVAKLTELRRRMRSPSGHDLALVGQLIATAALNRKESRGAHWRSDYPGMDARRASRSFVVQQPEPTIELAPSTKCAA